jgi:carboxylesterase type B
MMRIRTFLLVLSVDIIAGLKIQVNTKAGEIHGFVQKTTFQNQTGSVVTFLGIPYAQPPIGTLRFRKPRPFTFLNHPFNASEYGPGCIQNKFLMSSWLPGREYLSEDCLTLNIFQPNNGRPGLKSVMVWIP